MKNLNKVIAAILAFTMVVTQCCLPQTNIFAAWADSALQSANAINPPTELRLVSKTASTVNLAWNSPAVGHRVNSYAVFVNGKRTTTITTEGCTVSGLLSGSKYSFYIKSIDASGNESVACKALEATTDKYEDRTAPSVPQNIKIDSKTSTTVNLSWSASTDDVGVYAYLLYSGAKQIGTIQDTKCTVTGLVPGSIYTFSVKAEDAAGNISEAGNEVSVTTDGTPTEDYVVPKVPANLSCSLKTDTIIRLDWHAPDDATGIIGYAVFRDGKRISLVSEPSTYDINLKPYTSYTYTVKSISKDGLLSEDSLPFTVKTAKQVDVSDTEKVTDIVCTSRSKGSLTITWKEPKDIKGIVSYSIYRDGQKIGESKTTEYTDDKLPKAESCSYTVRTEYASSVSTDSEAAVVAINGLSVKAIPSDILKSHYVAVKDSAGLFVFTADAPICLTKGSADYNWTSADGGNTFRVLTQDAEGKWQVISNGKSFDLNGNISIDKEKILFFNYGYYATDDVAVYQGSTGGAVINKCVLSVNLPQTPIVAVDVNSKVTNSNTAKAAAKKAASGITVKPLDETPSQDSTITPTAAGFDKNTSKQQDIAVTMTLNGNTLTSIANGSNNLAAGTDYTVSPGTVTILKSYLAAQPVGTTTLTFNFSVGVQQTIVITITDSTADTNAGDYIYMSNYDGTITISGYNGTESDVVIPSNINGCAVSGIYEYAFYNNETMNSVTLPDSLKNLNYDCFSGCTNLTTVITGDGLSNFVGGGFYNCDKISKIVLGKSIQSYSNVTSTSLSEIDVESGNTKYCADDGILYSADMSTLVQYPCSKTQTDFTIPDGIKAIQSGAFQGCVNLHNVALPDSMTSIADYAFENCIGLSSISLKDTVTSIGNGSFCGCTGLSSITLPDALTSIGQSAFYGCTGLSSITIPGTVTNIGNYAFESCTNLSNITIPETVTGIADCTFENCTGLSSITLPDALTSIGQSAFYGCTGLSSITLPDTLTSIGQYSFYGCTGLSSITLPDTLTSIGQYAFSGCTGLSSITLPDTLTSIGQSVLYGCTGLSSVKLPGDITNIGNSMFSGCTSLSSITIPDTVTYIGDSAFEGCSGLNSISIPSGVTSIGSNAFSGCSNISTLIIPDGVSYISNGLCYNCGKLKSITMSNNVMFIGNSAFEECKMLSDITIPDKVIGIGQWAFEDCNSMTNINIPNGVASIDSNVFVNCNSISKIVIGNNLSSYCSGIFNTSSSVTDIEVADGNTNYKVIDGVLYTYDMSTLVEYPSGNTQESFVIPDGVKTISEYAFSNNAYLKTVTIPEGVTKIGDYAFKNCTSLTTAAVPDSVTSMGTDAFSGCTNLSNDSGKFSYTVNVDGTGVTITKYSGGGGNVVIPATINGLNVTAIADNALNNGNTITNIKIPDTVSSIGNSVFYGCTSLQSIDVASENTHYCSQNGVLFSYDMSTIILYPSASQQTTYDIPDGVTSISDECFYNSTNLTNITIPDSVTSIGAEAFGKCTSLTTINMPNKLNKAGYEIFCGCTALFKKAGGFEFTYSTDTKGIAVTGYDGITKNLAIPSNIMGIAVTEIGQGFIWDGYWSENSSLGNTITCLTIPDSVTKIDDYAFEDCNNLSTVTLGNGVTEIGRGVFENCCNLGTITLGTNVAKIHDYAFEDCSKLTGITFQSSVTEIGGGAFEDCYGLKSINIIGDNAVIDGWAFEGCSSLNSVVIKGTVSDIGTWAFEDCGALTNVDMQGSVTSIEASAFENCCCLNSITFPDGLKTIGDNAFEDCRKLSKVIIPDSVTDIGQYAFEDCESLTTLVIGNSVTNIGNSAFEDCYSLTSLVIGNSVENIGDDAFCCCYKLTSIEIPDCVINMKGAFVSCISLKSVKLGKSVANIEYSQENYYHENYYQDAFEGCTSLASIDVSPDNVNFCSVDGILYSHDMSALVVYPEANRQTSFTIPDSVNTIEDFAFEGNINLKTINMPNGLTNIGRNVFGGCTGITNIVIPDSVTSIGNSAFAGCTGITDIVIPDSVTNIDWVFQGCTTLTTVTLGKNVSSIKGTFENCSNLAKVIFKGSVPGADSNSFNSCPSTLSIYRNVDATDFWDYYCGYAVKVYCNVTINSQDGSAVKQFMVDCGTPISKPADPVIDGYTCYGWYTSSDCSDANVWDFAQGVTTNLNLYPRMLPTDNAISLNVDSIKLTSVSLSWSVPDTYSDAASFKVYRDGKLITTVTDKTYTDTGLTVDTNYTYYVVSSSSNAQTDISSQIISVKTSLDTTLPTILGISPIDGTKIGTTANITVRAEDNIAVSKIKLQYSLNGTDGWTDIASQNSSGVAYFTWTTPDMNGVVYIRAIATDASGNDSTDSPVRSLIVDRQGPAKITGLAAAPGSSSIALRWNDVTDDDFAYFQVEQQNGDGTYKVVGTTSNVLGMNITGLSPNTAYHFRVAGYDNLGNRGEAAEIDTATSNDTQKPVVTGLSPKPGHVSQSVTVTCTANDNVGVTKVLFQTSADGKTWTDLKTVTPAAVQATVSCSCTIDTSAMPEGVLYVRAIAYDADGNTSDDTDSAPFVQYMIDHTAPAVPTDVSITPAAAYITVSWNQGTDTDVAYYRVYRADAGSSTYTLIADNVTYLSYSDTTTVKDKSYSYKVVAVDTAGNASAQSEAVTGKLVPDTTAPKIISANPASTSDLGANPNISVLASDDCGLSKIVAEYQTNGSDTWQQMGTQTITGASGVVTFKWDTTGLKDGTYKVRFIAYDSANNASDAFTATYTLNVEPPKAPEVTATAAGWAVNLSWTASGDSDLAGYYIYRNASSDGTYVKIAQTKDTAYSDTPLKPGSTYYYKVEAVDTYGNISASTVVSAEPLKDDTIAPVANAGSDISAEVGKSISFDGSHSTDNDSIASYVWDFGDGTQGNGAKASHTYGKEGTYTVKLTVTDASGNSAVSTISVVVHAKAGTLNVRVLDADTGEAISNADVYVGMSDNSTVESISDSNGTVTIAATVGSARVAAYKDGYLPADTTVTVTEGESTQVTVKIKKGQLVVGTMTVHRMTLSEITAAGIDVTAAANQYVYNYEVHLTFKSQPLPTVNICVNGQGQIFWNGGFSCSGGSISASAIPCPGHPEVAPTVAFLTIDTSASWLKEFFKVDLTLQNMADPQFVITDSSVTLDLPDGISLAPTTANQNTTINIGDIAGQQTKDISWIIEGDKEGSYNLQANFSGTLMPFSAPVNTTFKTASPFKVMGASAIHIYIYPEEDAQILGNYFAKFKVVNTSDVPVYKFKITLNTNGQNASGGNNYSMDDPNENSIVPLLYDGDSLSIGTLEPGACLSGTFCTNINGSLDDTQIDLLLTDAFVTSQQGAGSKIPVTVIRIPNSEIDSVYTNMLTVTVVDESGNSISDAAVSVDSQNYKSNVKGIVQLTNLGDGVYIIKVHKDGYCDYTGYFNTGLDKGKIIVLRPKTSEVYISTAYVTMDNVRYEIGKRSFYIDADSKETDTFAAFINWNGHAPGKIYLKQGPKTQELGTVDQNGMVTATINIASLFGADDQDIMLVVKSSDGSTDILNTQIVMYKQLDSSDSDKNPTKSVDLHLTTGNPIIPKVSFFPGEDFGVDIPVLQFEVEVESDGKIKYVLDPEVYDSDSDASFKNSYDEAVKAVNEVNDCKISGRVGAKVPFEPEFKIQMGAFIDAHVTKTGAQVIDDGGIIIKFDGSIEKNFDRVFMAGPIPVPYCITLTGDFEATGSFKVKKACTADVELSGNLELEPSFELFLGLGIKEAAAAGITGKISITGIIGDLDDDEKPLVLDIEIGLQAEVLDGMFEKDITLVQLEWPNDEKK